MRVFLSLAMSCVLVNALGGCATSTHHPLPYTRSTHSDDLLLAPPHSFLALGSKKITPIPKEWFFSQQPRSSLACTWIIGGLGLPTLHKGVLSFLRTTPLSPGERFEVTLSWRYKENAQPVFTLPMVYTPPGYLMGTRTLPLLSSPGQPLEEQTGEREEYVVFAYAGKNIVGEFQRWVADESSGPLQHLPRAWLTFPNDPYKSFWHATGTILCDEESTKILPEDNPK